MLLQLIDVPQCAGALAWFHAARGKSEWYILLWCLAAQTVAARHLSSCWRLLISSTPCICKSTNLLRHCTSWHFWLLHLINTLTYLLTYKIPDFTPDIASRQIRPQFCILQIIESHSGSVYLKQQGALNIVDELWLLSEWYFINRMTYYISQGRVETSIRRGGQFCCKFTSVSVCKKIIKLEVVVVASSLDYI